MVIDWFTVGAQAINFLILVWLMNRFLYKPILHAIDEREKKIAAELADAAAKKAEAKNESDDFRQKNEEFDKERSALIGKAKEDATVEGQRLLNEARKAADEVTLRREEALVSEARSLNLAIIRQTQQEVFGIARKVLADLANTSLEERMCEVFTKRLRSISGQVREGLGAALMASSDAALVRSTFDLSAAQRQAIQNAVNETFSINATLRFETAADLISGIELASNGQKVSWSIADYLLVLENTVGQLVKKHSNDRN